MKDNKWLRLLTYVTGLVNQELLVQNEYLRQKTGFSALTCRRDCSCPIPSGPHSPRLVNVLGETLWRRWLKSSSRKPSWPGRLIANKFDGSKYRSYPGRPRIAPELDALILNMATGNSGWGYDRIMGALTNLGHQVSDQTVGYAVPI